MLSLDEIRILLPNGETLTDEQVEEIRDSYYELAQLAFDVWIEKKKKT